ncbi:MAG: carboxylating nicotinate-nucleotide diphosphorylase [Caldilineae bacterium]|nr:carboxylating nicotinate-nucleotide diphosphorylase [Chloroflexota bacterium]MCB9176264.1 carboxylating nicotinate-nucleotide diphosphorylase [Caldilineae bacterium]
MPRNLLPPHRLLYEDLIDRALAEDLGRAGDLSTDTIIPADASAMAAIIARQAGRVAGIDVAAAVFERVDPRIRVDVHIPDGQDAPAGGRIASVSGPARGILTGERCALNLLGRLSGIASVTRGMAEAVAPHGARVVCTRKTTPTLRALEKYAVRCGGGFNHRFGLDDAVLIKDNHIAVAGGIEPAVLRAREALGHLVPIEVEVDSLEQLEVALALGVQAVLLDNMDLETLRRAVALTDGRAITEASGGIRPDTAAAIAATGVDILSAGWLTHSAPTLDVALDIQIEA